MKIICLEEHVATPGIIAAWRGLDPAARDPAIDLSTCNEDERRLLDHGHLRIAAMDAAGSTSLCSRTRHRECNASRRRRRCL